MLQIPFTIPLQKTARLPSTKYCHMYDFAAKVLEAKETSIFSVGQAGFIVKSNSGQLLAIDLYLSECVKKEIEVFGKYKSAFGIRGPCSDKRNKMC